jgi:hypothetical protein
LSSTLLTERQVKRLYKAHRDYRFEYAHDVVHFIEEEQCFDCVFKNSDKDDMMCDEIAIGLILEEPLADLDDRGNDGVVCTKYRNDVLAEREHPDQHRLFDTP